MLLTWLLCTVVLTTSARQPLVVQWQPSVTEVSEQLSHFQS